MQKSSALNCEDASAAMRGERLEDELIESMRASFDEETFAELIGGLIDDVRWRLDRLAQPGAVDDLERVFRDAHDIKSVTGGFGLHALHEIARDIEHAAREGNGEPVARALPELIRIGRTQITTIALRYRP